MSIKNPMTIAEIRALPASVDFPAACRALGIGRTLGYRLAKAGEFPVKPIKVGKAKYKVPKTGILAELGIKDLEQADKQQAEKPAA